MSTSSLSLGGKDLEDGKSYSSNSTRDASSVESIRYEIAKKQTTFVFYVKRLVLGTMLLSSAIISTAMYISRRNGENDELQSQLLGTSRLIKDAFVHIASRSIGAMSALKVAAVSQGIERDEDNSWPFITIPAFQERAKIVHDSAKSIFVAIHPVVSDKNRLMWEKYVVGNDSVWIDEAIEYQSLTELMQWSKSDVLHNGSDFDPIFYLDENGQRVIDPGPGYYLPSWEQSPLVSYYQVNQNLLRKEAYVEEVNACQNKVVIGKFHTTEPGSMTSQNVETAFYAGLMAHKEKKASTEYDGAPISYVYLPIRDMFHGENSSTVAILSFIIKWDYYFQEILAPNTPEMLVVLESSCQGPHTFSIKGEFVEYLGLGDYHDEQFDMYVQMANFDSIKTAPDGTPYGMDFNQEFCPVQIRIYPSREFYSHYKTSSPAVNATTVAALLLFSILMFILYERIVEFRQKIVLDQALRSAAIVTSMFPKNVQDRLMNQIHETKEDGGFTDVRVSSMSTIADFFPNATVFFGDICNFTSWSSAREPSQVFLLLQSIYHEFDIAARRRKVFKVETIGDSYVAVTGVPDKQDKHYIIMARFAVECLSKMSGLVANLQSKLGPGTAELTMRIGIHSGPVTAGVLVGDRARFQLFGDTVNTAARLESSGAPGRIQVSEATAKLLSQNGKGSWITQRKEMIDVKGKGVIQTYWLNTQGSGYKTDSAGSCRDDTNSVNAIDAVRYDDAARKERNVEWICHVLAYRVENVLRTLPEGIEQQSGERQYIPGNGSIPLFEVAEVVPLRSKNEKAQYSIDTTRDCKLDEIVLKELRSFVCEVAETYQSNPFHNFEHACHVTMSVNKLMSRVVSNDPSSTAQENNRSYTNEILDPLAQLATVFAAVIHDADHRGVSNGQLMKEDEQLSTMYSNRSIAEQNSLDITWMLLMNDRYRRLRHCMFSSDDEMNRFRQILVNLVLATDIFDKELSELRTTRWKKAFENENIENLSNQDQQDLQATVVIEHLMQASDVSHTMQHWHIYRKWNTHLFYEMYDAYREGRMATDPTLFWYNGELKFFDNYIIPLTMKLKECQVFGVSSDEYLSYAIQNRAEWAARGEEIIQEMIQEATSTSSSTKNVGSVSVFDIIDIID